MPQSCCGWHDLLPGDRVPSNRVLLFRDLRGSEWLGVNRMEGPDGERPIAWSFIRP